VAQAHTADEHVEIAELHEAADLYATIARRLLQ
jgi:acetylornithine deacetylase/succinyl-diaminopimelate desuccinylase-like protein